MYHSHWGLSDTPFRACHDPRHFYQSPTHDEALARLQFLVEQRRRLGLLLGVPGTGKSLLLEVFASEVRRHGGRAALVNALGLDGSELLRETAQHLGLNLDADVPLSVVWQSISDRLREFRYEQANTVLLFDNADQAVRDAQLQILRLAQIDWSPDARLTLVLSLRPDRLAHLHPGLRELAELRVDLEPWEPVDTENYVKLSLQQAGCPSAVFAEPALVRLHELAEGNPRRVGHLADLALLAAAGRQLDQIDAQVVESVYHELGAGAL